MPNLPSSGQLSMGAIADNQSSASRSNLSLKTQSEAFASGSEVAGTPTQTTARANLIAAPYSISEFFNADFVSDVFSNISITTAGGGSDKNTVDGENLIIGFDADPDSGDFTVQLVDSGGNVDDTETRSGEGSVTFSSLALDDGTYTPRIRQGFASADGDTITHHDAIGTITITDPSDTTVANNSVTTAIEHGISITNDTAFNNIDWTFAKSSGDGSAPSNIFNSSDRSPTVNYTGVGVFTINCNVDGDPSGRNSSTATQVTHRIDFTEQITINNPTDQNQGTNYNITGNHKGFSGGIEVDEILASNNSVLSSNDDSTDSRVSSTDFSQQITPSTGGGNSTRSVKAKAHKGSVSATSNAYDIFPLMTTSKNVINPTSQTIFSSTRNTDTSTFPTSFTFSSPSTRTDNVTQGTYTEQADSGNAISLSGDTTPSSQTTTQPTVNAGVSAGTGTVRYTVTGSVGQETATDCAVTVNFSKEIFSVSTVNVAGNDTINDNITFSFSNQGFNLLSTRFELIDASDDTTQIGNDSDSTSFTGGGLQATNTENVTLTSQASTFGNSTGGTYKIKISLFENDSQSGTPIKTALTDSFQTFSITEFTSTFKGVDTGEGTFIGYASKLLAAENNSSTEGTANRIISQAISGAKLFALNLNQGSTVGRNNNLSTTFDGNEESGQNFFNNDGSVIEINGSDGVIDSVTDGTPATLNAVSEISDATDDVTIRITGDTTVIRVIHVVSSVNIGGASMASFTLSEGTGTTQQNSSFSVDKSLKTLFGASLSSGTTFGITVGGVNEAESGSLSSNTNVTTDAPATAFTDLTIDTIPYVDGSGIVISDVFSISLSNGAGNTTVTIDDSTISSDLQTAEISLALSTSDTTPDSFSELHDTDGNSQTLSIGHTTGNLFFAFKVDDADETLSSSTGDDAFTMSFTNNGVTKNVSGTFRFHNITSGDTASSVTFSNADVNSSTIKFSDEFIVTITGCSADDQVVFTASRTGANFIDLDDFKLSMNTTNGTDAYNASGVSVGTGAQETAAVTTSTSRDLTFTGLSAGTNTFTGMIKASGDGTASSPFNQSGTVVVKATYSNTSGNTISNRTVHTFSVDHNTLI